MFMNFGVSHLLLLSAVATAVSTSGITTVGGINFQDNAFSDTLISSSGNFTSVGGTLAHVLTDNDPGTYAFSLDSGAYVQLGFTDNNLINGPGPDLAFFELGAPTDTIELSLTIGGTTINYVTVFTGDIIGTFPLNVRQVNLDDFGIASGASLNGIVLGLSVQTPAGNGQTTVPSLSLVAAINSSDRVSDPVPDGGSMAGLCAGTVLGLFGISRLLAQRSAC
jgi:hypothetical protein